MSKYTRRQFLSIAGGITFLSLVPLDDGLFADSDTSLPRFTALPYVQPGNSSRLIDGSESIALCWQTEMLPAEFVVQYGASKRYGQTARITRTMRWQGSTDSDRRYNYAASLEGLSLSRKHFYRVVCSGKLIAEGYFSTRKKRGEAIRFVSFGDNAFGDPGEKAVAYYAYQAHPDFIMNTGDNVYDNGLDSQYAQYFYPIYNSDKADPSIGAPLLRSVPFYTVMANHDVTNVGTTGGPVANFDIYRDSLAYYTAMSLPLNGPKPGENQTPTLGASQYISDFQACAQDRFPTMANYSFDYGDAHFTCLDSNLYIDPTDSGLQSWIESDLKGTDALWKIVVYHHPAFNAGPTHYRNQQMRVLSPLFEACGVDLCLNGHEHVYQRSLPLRFKPTDTAKVTPDHIGDRRIPGDFTIDTNYDGKTNTIPNGIVYITTGAGGKALYDPGFDDAPEKWLHPDDNNAAYVARFFSSKHSLTVIDIDGPRMTLRQIDETGKQIDQAVITKPTA